MLAPSLIAMAVLVADAPQAARSAPKVAAALEPVRYSLRFPAPHTHYVEVDAQVPTDGRPAVELMMPVWTPGSYLVREFSRNVEEVTAEGAGGAALAVTKTQKNRWRVATGGARSIHVRYRVYCRELTVRTNFVDAEFALLNGAATFLTLAGSYRRPHEVAVELPPAWKTVVSALPTLPGASPNHFRAADFDALVDAPLVAGNPSVHPFDVRGTPHLLVNVGGDGVWDGPKSADLAKAVIEVLAAFWDAVPYDRYVIFNVLNESGGGGIEHANSTVLMNSRWALRTTAGTRRWQQLVSHEVFHAWNVKRLRPVELGPFDYERENHTPSLWIAEGLTSYYAGVLAYRAGAVTRDERLGDLSNGIRSLQLGPGRLVSPLEQASFDAWIKAYRPDENTQNTTVDYYGKGALVGFLVDVEIRRATSGARSLDDAMRLAYRRYSGERGFTAEEFRAVLSETAGRDLGPWLDRALASTEELDFQPALDWFGLRFRPVPDSPPARPAFGAELRNDGGRLVVVRVRRGTPAFDAGLNVDDEILAIDDYRVRADRMAERLDAYRPGDRVTLLVARRDVVMRLPITLGAEPADRWRLEANAEATADQKRHLDEWLKR